MLLLCFEDPPARVTWRWLNVEHADADRRRRRSAEKLSVKMSAGPHQSSQGSERWSSLCRSGWVISGKPGAATKVSVCVFPPYLLETSCPPVLRWNALAFLVIYGKNSCRHLFDIWAVRTGKNVAYEVDLPWRNMTSCQICQRFSQEIIISTASFENFVHRFKREAGFLLLLENRKMSQSWSARWKEIVFYKTRNVCLTL